MDEISVIVRGGNNLSDNSWWLSIIDADTSLPLDGSEGGLWSGNFVPPPPRPLFLEEGVNTDGLTTCDLCSWAWKNSKTFTLDATLVPSGKVEWVLTLVIVSLISAVVGAVIMVVILYCRRMKSASANANTTNPINSNPQLPTTIPNDKARPTSLPGRGESRPIWQRIFRKASVTSQLNTPPTSTNENHYTHMDETYVTDEALYTELDQYSNSPAYQNSGYTDPDVPQSSAPSSAYYSDLSINTSNDRTYEIIGMATVAVWDTNDAIRKSAIKLSAISETVTVPSDYV
ncbi:hypothetical protein FQA39_LY06540 [Lamprigera yunnana]|nr:hypothetical protein FQA39_LY06540 [Lamprigera yunnana]